MRFVGIDLAWSRTGRGRTGLCVADDGGRVLDSASVRTDDEIVEWVEPHCGGPVIAGIDAPITVPNATGRRPCDDLVSRVFGPYEAGVYPANRANPAFAPRTRAEDLADRLGLGLDPMLATGGPDARRALETYPHSAIVALFALEKTLKYKGGRGRSPATRRPEFVRLLDLLETLPRFDPPFDPATSPRWERLRQDVERVTTGAILDRAEDEVDAYVCAYVASYYRAHGHGDRCRVIGDAEHGHIVTPVAPAQANALDTRARLP